MERLRSIVPADGWFEWTEEKGHKQPWYIRLKTDRPMFLAAITNPKPGEESLDGRGFAIVTAEAEGGMVDVHDRRPIVFTAEDAALWLDNELPAEQAERPARSVTLPSEAFEWYPVSTDVNKVGRNDEHLIQPMEPISAAPLNTADCLGLLDTSYAGMREVECTATRPWSATRQS